MERFEFRKGTSDKFWKVEVQDNVLTVCFGRIGTRGSTKKRPFSSPSAALAEKQKLIQEKTRKGYVPSMSHSVGSRPPTAIAAIQVGEHVDEVARHLAEYLIECLRKKMAPAHFKNNWERQFGDEGGDEEKDTATVVDRTPYVTPDGVHYWEDEIEDIGIFPSFYQRAVRNEADKFIIFDDNAYVSIVALRGDPGAAEVEACVLQQKNIRLTVTAGGSPAKWPPELGPGIPIQSIWLGDKPAFVATLRDGTKVSIEKEYINDTNSVRARVFVGKKKVREYRYKEVESDEKDGDN